MRKYAIYLGVSVLLVGVAASASAANFPGLTKRPTVSAPDLKQRSWNPNQGVRQVKDNKLVVNTCQTENYQCAGAYQCEFIASRDHKDEFGNPVNMGNTMRFYSCNYTGGSGFFPSCSFGTPAGNFHNSIQGDMRRFPGGVREYTCQILN